MAGETVTCPWSHSQPGAEKDLGQGLAHPQVRQLSTCYNSFVKWSGKVLDSPQAAFRGWDTVSCFISGCLFQPGAQSWKELEETELETYVSRHRGAPPLPGTQQLLGDCWTDLRMTQARSLPWGNALTLQEGGEPAARPSNGDMQPRTRRFSPLVWAPPTSMQWPRGANLCASAGGTQASSEALSCPGTESRRRFVGFLGSNLAPMCFCLSPAVPVAQLFATPPRNTQRGHILLE